MPKIAWPENRTSGLGALRAISQKLTLIIFFLICCERATAAAVTYVHATASPSASPGPQKNHLLTFASGEQLELVVGDKQWFEKGFWPLVGPIAVLLFSNGVSICLVTLQASKAFEAIVRQRRIEFLSQSLNELYNPLLALTDINRAIFERTGPPSFSGDEITLEAAAMVWKKMKQKILVNNRQIETILRTKTHLMCDSDELAKYHDLMIHVAMYETFQKVPTDLYKAALFPTNIRQHVVDMRANVIADYDRLCREK